MQWERGGKRKEGMSLCVSSLILFFTFFYFFFTFDFVVLVSQTHVLSKENI